MDKKSKVLYWIESSEDDWKVANHLFEKGDYSYPLFFGHLIKELREWLLHQIKL